MCLREVQGAHEAGAVVPASHAEFVYLDEYKRGRKEDSNPFELAQQAF